MIEASSLLIVALCGFVEPRLGFLALGVAAFELAQKFGWQWQ